MCIPYGTLSKIADELGNIRRILEKQSTIEVSERTGEWLLVKGSNGKDYHKCSKCLHTQEITGVKNYCGVCGAKMDGDTE